LDCFDLYIGRKTVAQNWQRSWKSQF